MKRDVNLGMFMGGEIILRTESDMSDLEITKYWDGQIRREAEMLKSELLFKVLDKKMEESKRLGFWDSFWGRTESNEKQIKGIFKKFK